MRAAEDQMSDFSPTFGLQMQDESNFGYPAIARMLSTYTSTCEDVRARTPSDEYIPSSRFRTM
ncbi:hypothetical protein KP509_07G019400 [Ceratopteris richardii]|uniref:Uncharacterized protein n=1 Tax=Ceratopteris richardii TaxID=49495 RepID=A0A8T2UGC8_CERRI|nr:hypothetical protein KP509_07G019400 [Ceratopteris richardii]